MNGVDVANQLRASYNTHHRGCRNWLPLFYWLVDTLKVNSFILWRMHYPGALHKKFQLTLSQQLIAEGLEEHKRQLLKNKIVLATERGTSAPERSILSTLPPAHITCIGRDTYSVDNPIHILGYINRAKVSTRRCIVCKARTGFHCIQCQNALCLVKRSACIDRYPCSYTKIEQNAP